MKKLLVLITLVLSLNVSASEQELVNSLVNEFNIDSDMKELVLVKVNMHLTQKERVRDYRLPPKGALNLTPYMKVLAVFNSNQTQLLDMFQPYCESDSSPYGGFCMGSDIELTNWMLAHRNYYNVMKEVIIKWVDILDEKGKVDAIKDFENIRLRYKLSKVQFYPLIAFIGLDDNGIQYDRFLESLLNFNEKENYLRYFGLLYDIATINRDLPDFAIGKISYSLRTGTSKILSERISDRKTYKDFSLFGISCLALSKKIQKTSILNTTQLMTAGYEVLKLRSWSSKDWENPSKKINTHLEEAKLRADIANEVVLKSTICDQ